MISVPVSVESPVGDLKKKCSSVSKMRIAVMSPLKYSFSVAVVMVFLCCCGVVYIISGDCLFVKSFERLFLFRVVSVCSLSHDNAFDCLCCQSNCLSDFFYRLAIFSHGVDCVMSLASHVSVYPRSPEYAPQFVISRSERFYHLSVGCS